MTLTVIGISHKTAPIAIREQIAFTGDRLEEALVSLKALDTNAQHVILSTCNRVELYTTLDDMTAVINWMTHYHQVDETAIVPHLYSYHGHDAISHLMRVASGLDSMVLGEPQILGQLKDAYAKAKLMHTIGFEMDRAFTHAFSCAKAVRTLTEVGKCPVSVAFSAIDIGKQHLDLSFAKIGIVGAGTTAKLLVKHLQNTNNHITIFNRNAQKAIDLAAQYGANGHALEQIHEVMPSLDLLITATASQHPVITTDHITPRDKNLVIVDIAAPRDVEAAVGELDHIKLFTVDDIEQTITQNAMMRSQASIKASEIVDEHIQHYENDLNTRMAAPYIADYRTAGEQTRDKEIKKALSALERGVDPELVIRQLAHNLTNKLIHHPTKNLRAAGQSGDKDVLEFAQKLFKHPSRS